MYGACFPHCAFQLLNVHVHMGKRFFCRSLMPSMRLLLDCLVHIQFDVLIYLLHCICFCFCLVNLVLILLEFRLHAQALTLAALAGAALVEYYDHNSGAKADRYAELVPHKD